MGRRRHNINNDTKNTTIDDSITEKINAKDYDGLKALISQGKSLNNKNSKGQLPLELALINEDFDAAIMLIEGKVDVNLSNKLGLTFLHIMIRHVDKYTKSGHSQDVILSLAKKIIDAGASLAIQERRGNTPINFVAQLAKANNCLLYTSPSPRDA